MAEGDATALPARGRVPRNIRDWDCILFSYHSFYPSSPFGIIFGYERPYVRVVLPWIAIHNASLDFSWVRHLGSKCECKTLSQLCWTTVAIKKNLSSIASKSRKERSKEWRGMKGVQYAVSRATSGRNTGGCGTAERHWFLQRDCL